MSRETDTEFPPLAGASDEPLRDSGELAAALAAAAPRQWWNRTTLGLSGLALVVSGILGGAAMQKHWGTDTPAGGGPASFPAGGGFRGQNGAFPGGGPTATPSASAPSNRTTGTIKLVDGTTVYVQTADGTVVTVRTNGDTDVSTSRPGKLTDLKAGAAVTVQGSADDQGAITAAQVTTQTK